MRMKKIAKCVALGIAALGILASAGCGEQADKGEKTYKVAKNKEIDFAILKERSPSCGSSFIYDGSFSGKTIQGQGFTARRLNKENIVIFSEENLEEIEKYLEELNK